MVRDVFSKMLWDDRRSALGWALAVAAVAAAYSAFWPLVDTPSMQQAMDNYPEGLLEAMNYTDMTTAAGYIGATVYGLLGPLLIAVFAIGRGARTIAGDEQQGTLDLVLAHPVGRTRVAVQRLAALFAELALIAGTLWLAMVAVSGPAQLSGIGAGDLAAMTAQLALFGALLGTLTFAVGAASGRRAAATAIGAAVAVLGYLANGVFPQLAALAWTRDVSPWYWFVAGEPLRNGLQPGNCTLLVATTLLAGAAGTWAFGHRDIGT